MTATFSSELRSRSDDITISRMNIVEAFLDLVHSKNMSKQVVSPMTTSTDSNPIAKLGDIFDFLHYQYIAKFSELTSCMIHAANSGDYLIFALCGRSIIEATATLRYYNQKCGNALKNAANVEEFDTELLARAFATLHAILDEHLRGGRFNWEEFFTGDKETFTARIIKAQRNKNTDFKQSNPNSVNVLTLLNSWGKEEPNVHLSYAFFSELVHPNLGSNFLLMGVENGKLLIGGDTNKSVGRELCFEGIKLVAPAIKVAIEELAKTVIYGALGKPLDN